MHTHYWVYILHCENNSYYTGYTTDLARRFTEHVNGTDKCRYTRSFKPLSVAQCWQVTGDKADALRVEAYIKKLTKQQKTKLIQVPQQLAEIFASVAAAPTS